MLGTATTILLICEILMLVLAIVVFVVLVTRMIKLQAPESERILTEICLDTAVVKREFTVGDEFDHEGLLVTAKYSDEPYSETVVDFEVLAPDMSKEGKYSVTVSYNGKTAVYAISVVAPEPVPEPVIDEPVPVAAEPVIEDPVPVIVERTPVVIEEESVESVLRYNKSFTARLIQSDDKVKNWYTELKNELLSYSKVKARMSWKRETFRCGMDKNLGRLFFRGNTLCLQLPLNAAEFAETKYIVEDASSEEPSCIYRIKNDKRARLAAELIALVASRYELTKTERVSEDYYLPYEGIVELINKGLVKRNIKLKEDEIFFVKSKEMQQEVAVTKE